MATLELTIRYRPPLARIGRIAIVLSSVLWGIMPLIYLSGQFTSGLLNAFEFYMYAQSIVVGVAIYLFFADNRLAVSRQGICFPLGLSVFLWGRRNRQWYDLKSVRIISNPAAPDDVTRKALSLTYKSGGNALIMLRDLKVEEIEQLLLAIETFADDFEGRSDLIANKHLLSNKMTERGIKSYTTLWEDELRHRYTSTTFIPLPPGRTLQDGKLKVVRQLGFGGLSAIYLVQKDGLELVVLKEAVVPADTDDSMAEKAAELFSREATILARLKHPNIAQVLDHFVEDGRNYLLLQYINGQDLRQCVKERGKLPVPEVLRYARQIADILSYLHSQTPPIIHRDLTPENLVLNEKGQIVLIDFGAANEFIQTATGTLVGKHAYIAPEQFRGKATTQSDLYAFGGTLYFLLAASDPVALSESSPGAINDAVTKELDHFIRDLTKVDAAHRIESAQIALERLNEMVSSEKPEVE